MKKILTIMMALSVLGLVVAGCGSADNNAAADNTAATATTGETTG